MTLGRAIRKGRFNAHVLQEIWRGFVQVPRYTVSKAPRRHSLLQFCVTEKSLDCLINTTY